MKVGRSVQVWRRPDDPTGEIDALAPFGNRSNLDPNSRVSQLWCTKVRVSKHEAILAIVLATYEIDSPQLGKTFKIDLAEGLDATHVDFIEETWAPRLKRQYNLALLQFFGLPEQDRTEGKWIETLGAFGIQDQHWNWREKAAAVAGSDGRIFSLLNGADVEALMTLQFSETSREETLPIAYVDFLAVAPWNRKEIQHPQRFKHLGTLMLGQAVAISISAGLDGRCGLHSLPQSKGFYRRIGMTDYGEDAEYASLTYFEFSAAGAKAFVERGDK